MALECCSDSTFWLVLCGFIIAFVLAFGIGANDVANSFGTSVGSKVLTLKQACILATIFEILGSILIGAQVSGTIRKGIVDPKVFEGSELELMLGYVSALAGCCIWLIVATILNLPVSGTHSIVGATVGMALVSKGFDVIKWGEITKIVISWFISPLLSGVVSLVIFVIIRRFILRASSPLEAGLKYLPFIYTVTIVVNVGGILESAPPVIKLDRVPWWGNLIIELAIAVFVYLGVWLIMAPYMRKKIEKTMSNTAIMNQESGSGALQSYDQIMKGDLENRRAVGTQVDYITLIISRNPNFKDVDIENEKKDVQIVKMDRSNQEQSFDYPALPQSSYTIHSGALGSKGFKGISGKINRIRLDSAPSVANQEESYENVNLTLCGYLHGVHSPSFKQQLMQLKNYNKNLPAIQQGSAAATGADTAPIKLPSQGGGAAPFFNKIFSQPNQLGENQNEEGKVPLLNESIKEPGTDLDNKSSSAAAAAAAALESNKKVKGRFVSVPAKFQQSSNVETPAINKSSSSNKEYPISEDMDAVDILSELPTKKKKKFDTTDDEFAHCDPPEAAKLFSLLQVLTAIFGSFAHGGNDVSNAIGPLIGLYLIYQEGVVVDKAPTPEWILFYGGVGISAGLWILGRRVIKTIGEDLTKITPSSGFVIELASAMTVLGASILKIPVSTTHCKVGSVVFTGRVRSKQSVDWSLFRNIIIAWIVTVPVTGSIAAGCQAALKAFFIK